MKERFSLVTILFLIVVLMSGITQAQSDDPFARVGDPTLEGTVSWYLGGEDPFYFEIADAFMAKYPGIKINVMATPWGEWVTRFVTLASAGDMPDVVWFIAGHPGLRLGLGAWADELQDLSPFLSQVDPDDIINQSLLDVASVDGVLLGLPYEFNNIVLYYNKDLFDAAEVAYPDSSWTWDDLIAAGKKLTKPDGSQYGLVWSAFEEVIALAGAGASMVNADGSAAAYDTEEARAAYEFLYDIYVEERIAPLPGEGTGISLDAGTAAMEINGNWMFGTYRGAGINFGATIIPAGPAGHATLQRANIWSVSKNADCLPCALTFAQFLGFGEGLERWAASGRLAPYKRFTVESYLEATGVAGTEYATTFTDLMATVFEGSEYAIPNLPLPAAADNNDIDQLVNNQKFLLFVARSQDIETTLATLDEQLSAYLASKSN